MSRRATEDPHSVALGLEGLPVCAPDTVGKKSASPRHVYVVDDDLGIRRSTVLFLWAAGFEPRPFASGADFLDAAPDLRPGAVLLDVRMPVMDGSEVLVRLDGLRHRLPVIVMTGHGDVRTAVAAMKLGAFDFVEKPYDEASLLDLLDVLFSGLREQVRLAEEVSVAKERLSSLSPRGVDALRGLVEGLSNKEIAARLGLSVRTVEMHRAKMLDRLAVSSSSEALKLAIRAGFPPLSDNRAA